MTSQFKQLLLFYTCANLRSAANLQFFLGQFILYNNTLTHKHMRQFEAGWGGAGGGGGRALECIGKFLLKYKNLEIKCENKK